jgi:CRISPR-associated protein Csx17
MHELTLPGCTTRPLASYLKALAVFRLVAEQKDSDVTAHWNQGTFKLTTKLDPHELHSFFCDEYAPSPIITPWNGGSGFYPGDPQEAVDAIYTIQKSDDPRFREYRRTIENVLNWPEWAKQVHTVQELVDVLDDMISTSTPGKKQSDLIALKTDVQNKAKELEDKDSIAPFSLPLPELEARAKGTASTYKNLWKAVSKVRTKYKEHVRQQIKSIIIPLCRSRLPDVCVAWMDALCAIQSDGSMSHNQILGSYGNDGRLDFGNNFMKQVSNLLLGKERSSSPAFLSASLWNTSIKGLPKVKVGQFDPGRAGGYNQGMGIEAKDFKANPWDFVLTLEGTLVLASSVVKRQGMAAESALTSPFSVRFSAVGFTSSEYTEKEGGGTEIWMPVWEKPASYAEVSQLISEGRSSVGRRTAKSGLEFSRAVGTLGVDRGISAFERFAFLKRRGKSMAALPLGKIPVRYRPALELMNKLDPITNRLDQFMRGFKLAPASLLQARQQIDEDIFACTMQPDALRFLKVIRSLGRMEKLLAQRDLSKNPKLSQPLFGLTPHWISQCDDGSVEIRIASALASIHQSGNVGPLRSNMAGVSVNHPWKWATQDCQQHWFGSDLIEKLGNILTYRLMDAERKQVSIVPLEGNLELSPYDIMPFLRGETDDAKIEDLLWGLTLVDWKRAGLTTVQKKWSKPASATIISRTWALLKLLHTPKGIKGQSPKREKSISNLLQAGRIDEACNKAIQRLKVSNLKPFPVHFEEELDPARLLASLMIPIKDQYLLQDLVLETSIEKGEAYV